MPDALLSLGMLPTHFLPTVELLSPTLCLELLRIILTLWRLSYSVLCTPAFPPFALHVCKSIKTLTLSQCIILQDDDCSAAIIKKFSSARPHVLCLLIPNKDPALSENFPGGTGTGFETDGLTSNSEREWEHLRVL